MAQIIKELVTLSLGEIIPYKNNPRKNEDAVEPTMKSIKQCGYCAPILVDEKNIVLAGHTRLKAITRLGWKSVEVLRIAGLTKTQKRKYRLLDNKVGEVADWDIPALSLELDGLDFGDLELDWGLPVAEAEETEITEDEIPDPPAKARTKPGDIWKLGRHRLICGDSTSENTLAELLQGKEADLVFTDPPYGMGKESDGVLNDNLNAEKLLAFNKLWITLSLQHLKSVGSWYCWGVDEVLMDIYSEILKPKIKAQELTFRNLITWDKGNGIGQRSADYRMYSIADEKCLFVMKGVQGFDDSKDNFFEGFEPIRRYFEEEKKKSGLTTAQLSEIDSTRVTHYWARSQFEFPTRKGFAKIQEYCKAHGINAFGVEYEDIKREYEDIKREYYATRAYFDNTHDNMNNVWHFDRTSAEERELAGGHATPKPVALCARGIKSSSREGEIVLDLFGGSGSTLVACEQTGRACYMVELDPKWCDVIVKRWETLTGKKAVLDVKRK